MEKLNIHWSINMLKESKNMSCYTANEYLFPNKQNWLTLSKNYIKNS